MLPSLMMVYTGLPFNIFSGSFDLFIQVQCRHVPDIPFYISQRRAADYDGDYLSITVTFSYGYVAPTN